MSKTAIVIFSDPQSGSEEALGRLFNALFLAYELNEKQQEVAIVFQGGALFDSMTVGENVELPLTYLRVDDGQRRRAATARLRPPR